MKRPACGIRHPAVDRGSCPWCDLGPADHSAGEWTDHLDLVEANTDDPRPAPTMPAILT